MDMNCTTIEDPNIILGDDLCYLISLYQIFSYKAIDSDEGILSSKQFIIL